MEPNQQEQRVAADQEFLKALHELEDILQENSLVEEEVVLHEEKQPSTPDPDELNIDLAAWEDAVADIEQYFESKQKKDEYS